MSLVTANWKPTQRQLRQFGVLCALALPGLAWLWSLGSLWISGLALVGAVRATLAWCLPVAVKPIFVGLILVALPIGWVLSELILLLVYGLLFVPMGCVFRGLGRDRLHRKFNRQRESYWDIGYQRRDMERGHDK